MYEIYLRSHARKWYVCIHNQQKPNEEKNSPSRTSLGLLILCSILGERRQRNVELVFVVLIVSRQVMELIWTGVLFRDKECWSPGCSRTKDIVFCHVTCESRGLGRLRMVLCNSRQRSRSVQFTGFEW